VSEYLAMTDIARAFRVSERTARRWASQDAWRRVTSRPARYSLADAQASYERRHARRVERHLTVKYGDLLPDGDQGPIDCRIGGVAL